MQELLSSLTLLDLDIVLPISLRSKFVLSCEYLGVAHTPPLCDYQLLSEPNTYFWVQPLEVMTGEKQEIVGGLEQG
jgi:hypothetical protein